MIYNFDELPDRRATESIKWNKYGEDVLPLWVADMDFPSPQPVVQPPVYPPILMAPAITGVPRQAARLLLGVDRRYGIDWEAFEAAVDGRTRLFTLCNPQNPTGRVFSRQELERMAEICLRHEVVICSDEIHGDLVYLGAQHVPMASLDPEVAQITITLMSPSKTFNLPGLQFSYVIIQNPDLRERYLEARIEQVNWVNLLGQVAALAAYRDEQEWYEQLMSYLAGNRDYVDAFFKREMPAISLAPSEGTYLAWLDCRSAGNPGNPSEFFLQHARVALNDGEEFGDGGAGFVRLNFACPRALLNGALSRMRSALT